MNATAKVAVAGLIGGAAGWFVGSVIAAYIEMVEFERQTPYRESEEVEEREPRSNEETKMSKNKNRRDYTMMFTAENKGTVADLINKYNAGVIEQSSDDEIEQVASIEKSKEEIEIISVAEFANNDTSWEQVTLNYYEDDILTDENDNPIADPERFVGNDALVSFGELSGDENVVYVRNNKLKVEYEVVKTETPYILTEPKRPAKRRAARPNKDVDDEIGEENN